MEKLSLGEAPPIDGGSLIVLSGSERGEQVVLRERPITIGAARDYDLVLSDRTVSRRHLEVSIERGAAVARDLGTTNGSFAHGSRFTEMSLGYGAELRLGRTTLAFRPPPPTSESDCEQGHFGELIGYDLKMRRLFGLLRMRQQPTQLCSSKGRPEPVRSWWRTSSIAARGARADPL